VGHDAWVENHSTRPHHVAVVGSGPSGFYAAASLLDAGAAGGPDVRVDMYDRLATPWGLVRAGVAPDHPKIKSVSSQYDKTAAREGFRFFGHVHLGSGATDVTREELLERYDAIVYAVGSQTERRLGIPGEDLRGSVASVDFVGWYNGHPDYVDLSPPLDTERAVVIGAGNVALDVARMLLLPEADLRATDTADHAVEALAASSVREALVCGRRGPREASFTTTELRELADIDDMAVVVDPEQVPAGLLEGAEDGTLSKGTRRNLEILRRFAEQGADPAARHRMAFRFLRSPVEIRGDGRVEEIVLGINRLETGDDGRVRAVDTGERETVATGLVLRAVGYRGVELPGLPFDEASGTVPNTEGRVADHSREYVVGWIKRGPTGIIGTNKKDANETVRHIVADLAAREPREHSPEEVEAWLRDRCPDLVDQEGWAAIDAHERGRGEPHGRPRVKVVDRDELVKLSRP
jgi:ferredoxin/flavodoxin---NADP+ reductase